MAPYHHGGIMSLKGITYYRTNAYYKGDGDALRFWTIDPVHDKPDTYYIREHEAGKSHRYSLRISAEMTEREALHKIAEIEKGAEQQHRPADTKDADILRRMGDDYTDALPWREHPVHITEARQEELNRRKGHKPKLKP